MTIKYKSHQELASILLRAGYAADGNLVRTNLASTKHVLGSPSLGLFCKEGTNTRSLGHGSRIGR